MPEEHNEGFSIQDIANLVQIIDYAANQGAFKGWDTIRQVQAVRDKAAGFIELTQAQQSVKLDNGKPTNI